MWRRAVSRVTERVRTLPIDRREEDRNPVPTHLREHKKNVARPSFEGLSNRSPWLILAGARESRRSREIDLDVRAWTLSRARAAVEALKLSGANSEVADYWLSCWDQGRPPTWNRFRIQQLARHRPAIAVFEVHFGASIICRLAGSYYKLALGAELLGVDLVTLTPNAQREQRWMNVATILEGAVSVATRTITSGAGSPYSCEELIVPFADYSDSGGQRYLLHSNWRPAQEQLILGAGPRTHTSLGEQQRIVPFVGFSPETMARHARSTIGP